MPPAPRESMTVIWIESPGRRLAQHPNELSWPSEKAHVPKRFEPSGEKCWPGETAFCTVGKQSCGCVRESMPSCITGPLSTRRPIRMRSSNGPGPGLSVAGGGAPVMYCQSPLRKLTWISRDDGVKCGVMSNTFVNQLKLVSVLNIDAWPQGETQSNESPGAGVSVLSRLVLPRTRQP